MNEPEIYFVFPYRGQGGVPIVFSQLAEYLTRTKKAKCFVVDFHDGLLATTTDSTIQHITYSSNGVFFPPRAIVILQAMTPWSIYPHLSFSPTSRLLFWCLNPFNLETISRTSQFSILLKPLLRPVTNLFLSPLKRQSQLFVQSLISRHSLVFMDCTCTQKVGSSLDLTLDASTILPVPFLLNDNDYCTPTSHHSPSLCLSFCWIGRLEDFKTHSLISFALQLNAVATSQSLNHKLTIIGSGADEQAVSSALSSCSSLIITYIPYLPMEELSRFLLTEIDITYAMGTSALLSASLGIPTILAPLTHTTYLNDFEVAWFHEYDGYTLGTFYEDRPPFCRRLFSLVHEYHQDPSLGSQQFQYVRHHHSLPAVADKLLSIINSLSEHSTFSQIKHHFRTPLIYRFFKYLTHI